MNNQDQQFESYVPLYDAIPDKWEDAQGFITEQFKRIANAINVREIGWFLDEELLSGKQFIPAPVANQNIKPLQVRSVFRKVIDVSPLVPGVNPPFLHGITFDINFTLIDLWVSGTNSVTFTARRITGNDVVMNATQLLITSPQAFDRAFAVVEYILEI